MTKRFLIFIVAIGVLMAAEATAQKLTWSVDFGAVFDNREGDNSITDTKTYFLTSLAPEIGVRFAAEHRISGGVVWTNPIGNEWEGARVSPTLYYRYSGKRWKMSMGMFPRTQLREQMPGFLQCDSLRYYQRNIRGVLVQYSSREAFFDFYLDWRQMQTETKREAFNIVFHGQWRPGAGKWLVGGHAMMNHYALTRHASEDQHIVDNFLVNPYVGVDLSRSTALDSLAIKIGVLATIERNRAFSRWETPVGAWVEAIGEWKWLGLKNSFYMGGKLFPSYPLLGGELYQGEPFYQAKFYNRTDLYARIFANRWVNLEAALDFNVTDRSFIFYQRLLLRVYLDQLNCPFNKKSSRPHRRTSTHHHPALASPWL